MRRGRPGLLGTVARTAVIAGTATMTSNAVNQRAVNKRQQAADAQAYQEQQAAPPPAAYAPPPPPPAPAPPAPPTGDDLISKLGELAKLKEAGVLTEEEFAAAKARLLAG
jgi:hypothetical protein